MEDGSSYTCQWYEQDNNCLQYGHGYENYGKTANEACCTCGGGQYSSLSPPLESTVPSISPTKSSGFICIDKIPGWYDSDGEEYTVCFHEVYYYTQNY